MNQEKLRVTPTKHMAWSAIPVSFSLPGDTKGSNFDFIWNLRPSVLSGGWRYRGWAFGWGRDTRPGNLSCRFRLPYYQTLLHNLSREFDIDIWCFSVIGLFGVFFHAGGRSPPQGSPGAQQLRCKLLKQVHISPWMMSQLIILLSFKYWIVRWSEISWKGWIIYEFVVKSNFVIYERPFPIEKSGGY